MKTGLRILIIDDNVGLAENIAEVLQYDGHSTDVATNAEEAVAKALPSRPEVVVTDYRLPDTNGADLLRRLRQLGVQARAVVISAYTDDQTIEDARRAGAGFVPKPVDFGQLGRLIVGAAA